ncbi:hypothetical protein [Thalassotalea sp. PLHSN55]|uniref:hypothetical protein n=1 Tax=Thalassotalea sp. PLHSN55 TaxID=3435888 RepID=UPI003F83ABED
MSVANPLTAASDIAKVKPELSSVSLAKEKPLKPDLKEFSADVVEISSLAQEKLAKETQVEATRKIEDIASQVIRISSSIGKAKSMGNLTNQQATELYNKIASLL